MRSRDTYTYVMHSFLSPTVKVDVSDESHTTAAAAAAAAAGYARLLCVLHREQVAAR